MIIYRVIGNCWLGRQTDHLEKGDSHDIEGAISNDEKYRIMRYFLRDVKGRQRMTRHLLINQE